MDIRRLSWFLVLPILCHSSLGFSAEPPTEVSAKLEGEKASGTASLLTGGSAGMLLGYGVGYLLARNTGSSDGDDQIALLVGIGGGLALGSVVGGAVDLLSENGSPMSIILHDTMLGGFFGGVVGFKAGVVAASVADKGRAEDMVLGSSVGVLIGAGLGMTLGVLRGSIWKAKESKSTSDIDLGFNMAPVIDKTEKVVWIPGIFGRF